MYLRRAASSRLGCLSCNDCRQSIIRSFVSHSGLNIAEVSSISVIFNGQRHFSNSSTYRESVPLSSPSSTQKRSESSSHIPEPSSLPWYLQVASPAQPSLDPSHPLAQRQRIPNLPECPPPILHELFQYISVDLGLDDLTLFDLRNLDPPPALGSNLLMVIGSARSEKHLHVSADRLCRWLRSKHKLTPHADGLLGRNELKLKLKRKARRMRIMGAYGASQPDNFDDGIRTGWICVSVSGVEPHEDDTIQLPEIERFVGFGGQSDEVTLVVQMFTEEKRADIDLEGLWGGVLGRAAAQSSRVTSEDSLKEAPLSADDAETIKQNNVSPTTSLVSSGSSQHGIASQFSDSPIIHQIRHYHTHPLREKRMLFHQSALRGGIMQQTSLHGARSYTTTRAHDINTGVLAGENWGREAAALSSEVDRLKSLPLEAALEEICPISPRPFPTREVFRKLYPNLTHSQDTSYWSAVFSHYTLGFSLGHPMFARSGIHALLRTMCNTGLRVPVEFFRISLFSALTIRKTSGNAEERRAVAFGILEDMYAYGYGSFPGDLVLGLHETLILEQADTISLAARRKKFREWLTSVRVDFESGDGWEELLRSYASINDWTGFWEIWDLIPRQWQARSAALYKTVFTTVANSGDKPQCTHALKSCLLQMETENPRVYLSDVADQVLRCLRVVEPKLNEEVPEKSRGIYTGWIRVTELKPPETDIDPEWSQLYTRCRRALVAARERAAAGAV